MVLFKVASEVGLEDISTMELVNLMSSSDIKGIHISSSCTNKVNCFMEKKSVKIHKISPPEEQ